MITNHITCGTLTELVTVCALLTTQGIRFEAYTSTLTVNITGF